MEVVLVYSLLFISQNDTKLSDDIHTSAKQYLMKLSKLSCANKKKMEKYV